MDDLLKASGGLKETILLVITDCRNEKLIERLNNLYVLLVDFENAIENDILIIRN